MFGEFNAIDMMIILTLIFGVIISVIGIYEWIKNEK